MSVQGGFSLGSALAACSEFCRCYQGPNFLSIQDPSGKCENRKHSTQMNLHTLCSLYLRMFLSACGIILDGKFSLTFNYYQN